MKDNGDHSIITVLHGYSDGKKVSSDTTIKEGKNIGRANQTTHYTQAILEAKSKYNKKIEREGYFVKKEIVSIESAVEKVYFPMLAQDYNKFPKKLQFPAYIQAKLDGYRCIYNSKSGTVMSRQNKSFDSIKQTELYKELQNAFKNKNFVLDGELYVHNGAFEHLGILRKKTLSKQDLINLNDIEYHIYDIIDETKTYKERYNILQDIFKINNFKKIKIVNTYEIKKESEIKDYHQIFLNENYEGSILRNSNGMYKCKYRSYDLLKYKSFIDSEFSIVDYTFENNTTEKDDPLIVWICETKSGDLFNVRPKGHHSERIMLYKKCNDEFGQFKGKQLWVKYFELTENGIPRFPTTLRDTYIEYIRDQIL